MSRSAWRERDEFAGARVDAEGAWAEARRANAAVQKRYRPDRWGWRAAGLRPDPIESWEEIRGQYAAVVAVYRDRDVRLNVASAFMRAAAARMRDWAEHAMKCVAEFDRRKVPHATTSTVDAMKPN